MLVDVYTKICLILFTIIIIIFLSILFLEFAFRFFNFLKYNFVYEKVSRYDFLDPKYHSYIQWTDTWDKPMFYYYPTGLRFHNIKNPLPKVKNNSLGFRCDEFSILKNLNNNIKKVFLVGGSAAWGFGASSNKTTIAGYLEKYLNSKSKTKYKVINLSLVNQTQTQDLQILNWLLPILKPSLVIHYGGWNELIASSSIKSKYIIEYDMIPIREMLDWVPLRVKNNTKKTIINSFFTFLMQKLFIAQKLLSLFKNNVPFKRSLKSNVKLLSSVFISNMNRMNKISNAYNADFIQVLQPHIYRKKILTNPEKKAIELYEEHRQEHIGSKLDIAFLKEKNYFEELKNKNNYKVNKISHLNLVDLFLEDKEECFFSLVHCRDLGYKKVALKIFEHLNKNKKLI